MQAFRPPLLSVGLKAAILAPVAGLLLAGLLVSAPAAYALDGRETPANDKAPVQALTFKDLTQLSGVNLNGEARAMYINGLIEGVDRPSQRGGDIITLADGSIWLVAHVLENWNATAGWTKVAVTRQVS